MAREFKPVRFFVMMAAAALVVCGVTAFYTYRAAHGRTAQERAAYAIGEKAREEPPAGTKLPTDADLNMMLRSISSSRDRANSKVGTWLSKTDTRTGLRRRIGRPIEALYLCWTICG